MDNINEGSTSYHNLVILGYDGVPIVPDLLRYKVLGSFGGIIVDWTVIDSDTEQIVLSATINTISNTHGAKRYLTIEATHDTTSKITSEICYEIVNLKGILAI
jgi:hypothetical protein